MPEQPTPKIEEPRRGRPRDPGRDEAIIDATIDVLVADGYDNLTIDHVAATAGVGKTTIYRRWASKAELVIDAMKTIKPLSDGIDTGTLDGDLEQMIAFACGPKSTRAMQVMVSICSALPREPDLLEAFRIGSTEPRVARITAVLERARDRGELPDHVDIPMAASLVPSLMLQHALMTGKPAGRDYAERVMRSVLLPMLGRPSTFTTTDANTTPETTA
jgi:AcrR family transcriptional regulator